MSEEVEITNPKNSKDRVQCLMILKLIFQKRVKNGIPVMENIIEIISEDK